jgi:hypothetical protein
VETGVHDLPRLFYQLGLSADPSSVDAFLAAHALEPGQAVAEGPFWSPAQAAFLAQALAEDSEWSEAADELSVRLR